MSASSVVLARWRRGVPATVGLYVSFARLAFLKMLAYRLRYYTGVVSYTVFVAGNAFIYSALYRSRPEEVPVIGGLTLAQMMGYVILSWAGRSFYFNNIDRVLAQEVAKGDIALQLLKPYHPQTVTMSEALGEGLFRLLMFTLPIMIVVVPLFGLPAPPHPSLYGWTLVSFFLAFLVNAQISFLVGCLAFYLKNIFGVIRAKMIVMEFLTGVLVPFSFFPAWVQQAAGWLPFQAISYVPVTVYLGLRPAEALHSALILQAGWALGLFLVGRWFWAFSVRRVALQGG